MDKTEFKKLLFKVAFCAMACDGEIAPEEIEEMKKIEKNTSFFRAFDLSHELTQLIEELNNKGIRIVEELFQNLKESDLNAIQELIILEVAIRIIAADKKYDENEIKFINLLRAKLKVHDELIIDRFGKTEILHTNEYVKNIDREKSDNEFIENLELPELNDIKEIDFKNE